MSAYQMALLLDRLFKIEGKPSKERTAEDKAAVVQIRQQLANALVRIFQQSGTKDKDKDAYTDAVLADHES